MSCFLCVWFSSWEAPFGIKEQIHGYPSTEAYESEKGHIPKRRDALINGHCPHYSEVCNAENKAVQRDLCGIWAHAGCERIPSECYYSFNSVFSKVHNISYYCEVNPHQTTDSQSLQWPWKTSDLPSLRSLQAEQWHLHYLISEN